MNIHYSEALLLYMFHLICLCVPNKTKRILYLVITCAILFINTRNLRSTSLILCQCLYIRQSQFRHNDFFCLILISNSSCNSRNHSNHCNFHGFLLHTTMCFFLNLLISFLRIYPFNGRATTLPHQKNLVVKEKNHPFSNALPLTRSLIGESSALQYTVTTLLKYPGLSALYVTPITASLPGSTGSWE